MSHAPLQGRTLFESVRDRGIILMAANTRMTLVTDGIFLAAKEARTPVIVELAKSESDLQGGYTGLTPRLLMEHTLASAERTGFTDWLVHADHITIKKGTPDELTSVKALVKEQISAGFTSFAIDASHLFDFNGKTVEDELRQNIDATTELARFVADNFGSDGFGLEVEVGEIGRTDSQGMILTRPEEASAFIKALNRNGVNPQVLAIANGSTHGNIYDKDGNLVEQVSIDIARTREVAQALRAAGSPVRIAQHGITGTPRELIRTRFPHGDIIKGNVGTFWQNLVYDVLKVYEPELHARILSWTLEKYKGKSPGRKDAEIFGKNGKNAISHFFKEIYGVDDDAKGAITAEAKAQALVFFKAFNSYGASENVGKR